MSLNFSNIDGSNQYQLGKSLDLFDQLKQTGQYIENMLKFIRENFTMVIIVFNCLGNFINLMIFTRPSFRKVSMGFYLAALAIADTLSSFIVLYYYLLYEFNNGYLMLQSYYPFVLYFYLTVSFYSSWLSVLVTLDRCLSAISVKFITILNKR
jgi:hypothetical protein